MSVGDEQSPFAVDRQAARPIDIEIRSAPGTEEVPVAIEDLDSVGQVGHIEVILSIKGCDPRLVQPAVLGPVNSPYEIGGAYPVLVTAREKRQAAEYRKKQGSRETGHTEGTFTKMTPQRITSYECQLYRAANP